MINVSTISGFVEIEYVLIRVQFVINIKFSIYLTLLLNNTANNNSEWLQL